MTIRITIEGESFRRILNVNRIATLGRGDDARHLYEVVQTGGSNTPRATFHHRYGDPLHTLLVEAVTALEKRPNADKPLPGVKS